MIKLYRYSKVKYFDSLSLSLTIPLFCRVCAMDRGVTRRQTAVEKFSEVCREVLTERERRGLHKLLSDYYRRRRVERLIPGLFKVIREENRMEVIHVLRRLIPYTHLQEFDRQTRQRRARGELKTFFWEEEDDGIGTTVSFSSGML